jgi:hypothetical protein
VNRTHGDSGNNTPEPDVRMSVELALLTCQEGRFRRYVADGSNRATEGTFTALEAVLSGDPHFGFTHPWIWAIDLDFDCDADPGPLRDLLHVIDAHGLDWFQVSSGGSGRRHVYVHDIDCDGPSEGGVRCRVRDDFLARRPDTEVDWRMQTGGCPIRPPGAPHRSGGRRAEPIDGYEEALELLDDWALQHDHRVRPTSPAESGQLHDLSDRDQALLRGDWAEADRVGPPVPRHGGGGPVDRSGVDVALAQAFRAAGMPQDRFVDIRRPGGAFPSPRAAGEADPDGYLQGQWAWAEQHPVGSRARAGIAQIDEFRQRFVFENCADLDLSSRTVLDGFIARACELGRTTFDWSRREIKEATDLGSGAVQTSVEKLIDRGLLSRRPNGRTDLADRWQLRVGTALRLVGECKNGPQTVTSGTPCDPFLHFQSPAHPVFGQRAFKRTGWQTLLCFSDVEPRTISEAHRHGGPSLRTMKDRVADLRDAGVLVETSRHRYVFDRDFDFDAYAHEHGLFEHRAQRAAQHDEERRLYVRNAVSDPAHPMTASEAVERFASLAERERGRSHRAVISTPNGRRIDPYTGEILSPESKEVSQVPVPLRPASTLCRACGRPGAPMDDEIGLRRHSGCLFSPSIAEIERRHGAPIPDRFIRQPPGPDWGEFLGPDTSKTSQQQKGTTMTIIDESSETLAVAS